MTDRLSPEVILSTFETVGILPDVAADGTLTFAVTLEMWDAIPTARRVIGENGAEEGLRSLLLARRGDKPPLDRLVDELASGPVHWGRLAPRYGEDVLRAAKRAGAVVEQADGLFRLPREGEGRAPVRAAARPRPIRAAGSAEDLLGRLARGALSWNEVRPFGPDVVAELIRAGRIEAALDGRFYLAGRAPREDAA